MKKIETLTFAQGFDKAFLYCKNIMLKNLRVQLNKNIALINRENTVK
jgi:hypothetical protein